MSDELPQRIVDALYAIGKPATPEEIRARATSLPYQPALIRWLLQEAAARGEVTLEDGGRFALTQRTQRRAQQRAAATTAYLAAYSKRPRSQQRPPTVAKEAAASAAPAAPTAAPLIPELHDVPRKLDVLDRLERLTHPEIAGVLTDIAADLRRVRDAREEALSAALR
jgi:hypothetical protein